ncbi:MAG: precorrin-3B C(17)-methyltransferase [Rhodobacteraceae bacterium]|nr:precorrin-3B C(17)-methyltransferase [Paracoccaceae bacterium]
MAVTPVVVCLSRSGEAVAHRVAQALGAAVHGRAGRVEAADADFADTMAHLRDLFAAGVPVVGVCAAGILIRAVAPLLGDKRAEPPLVALSEDGAVAVPLLGGHRGANDLARRIAALTGGVAAVTTAGDVALGVALDAPPAGYRLANPGDAKAAMAALIGGAGARLSGLPLFDLPDDPDGTVEIRVTEAPAIPGPDRLVYHPQAHVLGVGCARGTAPGELWDLAEAALTDADLAPGALAAVATLDLKADEPAVIDLAARLGVPLRLFDAAALDALTPRLATPSEVVFAEVGCHGVAEAAALAVAGAEGKLVLPKIRTARATCAIARAPAVLTALPGRARGRLSLVGIGPGQAAWRTPEASRLIAGADELVGYGLYIDLLGPLAAGKPRRDFPLGGEEDRCRYALEEAAKGRDIALICSGDAGIYAMGALVFELMDRDARGVSDAARRVEVVTAPGISALQAAAARAGAPLGHDFCAISLSDLLTPRADIVKRLRAAAEGDFVIAFYNPVSARRRTLLAEAREILLAHRPASTPVLLAASLGRPEERLRYRRLDELDVDEVDMLTLVLVGSSQSRLAELGEGPRFYTPRGYAAKLSQTG